MSIFLPKAIDKPPLTVKTMTPSRKDIHDYINVSGKIKEGNKRNIYVSKPGKITKIYVNSGDTVSAGDVLAEIVPLFAEDLQRYTHELGSDEILTVLANWGFEMDFEPEDITRIMLKDEPTQIISPINGTVTAVNIEKDNVATPFLKIISVSDFDNLYVSANIPEVYSLKISENDRVKISAAAFGTKTYNGKIENISPVVKYIPSLTGNGQSYIEARISIDNPTALIRPGLNINAKITAETKKDALTLPYECIMQDDKNREYVFCIKNGIVKKRFIISGYELEGEVEIKSGLTAVDKVILNPNDEIFDNMSVTEN